MIVFLLTVLIVLVLVDIALRVAVSRRQDPASSIDRSRELRDALGHTVRPRRPSRYVGSVPRKL